MARLLDFSFPLLKGEYQAMIAGWTGFNTQLIDTVPEQSIVTSSPPTDDSAKEYDTLNTVLLQNPKIADQSYVKTVVVVMDEATYAKAIQIRWSNETFTTRTCN